MPWLVVTWFLAFGYVPLQYDSVYLAEVALVPDQIATVSQIGLRASIGKRFSVYGQIETYHYLDKEQWYDGGALRPYRADYTAGAEFAFNDYLSVLVLHECDHVIKRGTQTDGYESSETQVLLKLEGQTRF